MTKQQKAIFSMNKWIEIAEQGNLDNYAIIEEDIEYFKVILNLIQEQEKEIEYKQDDINVLEAQRDSIENQFKQAKSELKKKDKIIDELEDIFYNYQLCEYELTDCTYRKCEYIADDEIPPCKECIKQYFEKKVTDTNVGD